MDTEFDPTNDIHKQIVCEYISSTSITNNECFFSLENLVSHRKIFSYDSSTTLGYVFSSGHPELITTFFSHLMQTLNGKECSEGTFYIYDVEKIEMINVIDPDPSLRYKNLDISKIYGGIILDLYPCYYSKCSWSLMYLYEIFEIYKMLMNDNPMISFFETRKKFYDIGKNYLFISKVPITL